VTPATSPHTKPQKPHPDQPFSQLETPKPPKTNPQNSHQPTNFAPPEVGDANNARALFERALTEEPNRRSAALWERYLALEFEVGDLHSALRLEKRAREALGLDGSSTSGSGGDKAAGGGRGLQLQLLLLRYEFGDSLPCAPSQRQYLLHLMGRGPPPAGFDRAARAVAGGAGGAGGTAGPAGDAAGPAGAGGPGGGGPGPGGPGGGRAVGSTPVGGLFSGVLPWVVEEFLNRLPPPELLDGPMPDVAVLVDAFINTDFDSPAVRQALLIDPVAAAAGGGGGGGGSGGGAGGAAARGVKRDLEEEEEAVGGARDAYRMRLKSRARAGGDG
jgi:hypothetical protein